MDLKATWGEFIDWVFWYDGPKLPKVIFPWPFTSSDKIYAWQRWVVKQGFLGMGAVLSLLGIFSLDVPTIVIGAALLLLVRSWYLGDKTTGKYKFKKKKGTAFSSMVILLIFVFALVFFVSPTTYGDRCESLKSQYAGLCATNRTVRLCQAFGNTDYNLSTPDSTGNECEWINVASDPVMINMKCIVKSDIDWVKIYPDECG